MDMDADALTTLHVRRARAGDLESLAWLAQRFQPLLRAQARYRLGRFGARALEPDDLVGEVWAVALPKLAALDTRDGRATPVVLRFLSTTLLQLANNHVRKSLRRGDAPRADDVDALAGLSDAGRRVLSEVGAREESRALQAAIDELAERDREVVLLRGIEQLSNADAAALLGETPNAVSLRYRRALERLRARLPGSVFDELDAHE